MPMVRYEWKGRTKQFPVKELGASMLKQWSAASMLMVAAMIMVFLAACGSNTDTGSGSTTKVSTLGTPGAYNCVQGSVTAAGSTALAPLVQAVAQSYQAKCSGASITVNLGGSGAGL